MFQTSNLPSNFRKRSFLIMCIESATFETNRFEYSTPLRDHSPVRLNFYPGKNHKIRYHGWKDHFEISEIAMFG